MATNKYLISSFIFAAILIFSLPAVSADLGMVAGPLNFNVSAGGHETMQFRAFNNGGSSINFNVIPPSYAQIPNQTTPTIVITPQNGSIAPHSQLTFNVTVYMPGNDKPGDFWDNIAQVVAVGNATSASGATVSAGVGKEISITSAPAKTDWTLIYAAAAFAVIVVVIAACAYYFLLRGRKGGLKVAAKGGRFQAARAKASARRRRSLAKGRRMTGKKPKRVSRRARRKARR